MVGHNIRQAACYQLNRRWLLATPCRLMLFMVASHKYCNTTVGVGGTKADHMMWDVQQSCSHDAGGIYSSCSHDVGCTAVGHMMYRRYSIWSYDVGCTAVVHMM